MRRDEEDHLGVGEVRRRAVVAHPRLVADAGVRRADVGVAVVAVDVPRLEHTIGVAVLAGAADVVHHLVAAALLERPPDAGPDLVERLVPRDAFPAARPSLARALQRMQHPLGVVDLVERRRSLGAVAAAAGRVLGVALELGDLAGVAIDVRGEPARRFAVEARRRHERVVALDAFGPRLGVELGPVVPLVVRRVVGESTSGALSSAAPLVRRRTNASSYQNSPPTISRPAIGERRRDPVDPERDGEQQRGGHDADRDPTTPEPSPRTDPSSSRRSPVRRCGYVPTTSTTDPSTTARRPSAQPARRARQASRRGSRGTSGTSITTSRIEYVAPPAAIAWASRIGRSSGVCHRSRPSHCPNRNAV